MSRAEKTAAVVLAAGRSSRMGTCKPVLPLGPSTVLEHVVTTVAQAGIQDVVVVTGHEPVKLQPLIDRLPARSTHNADYDSGMFSSVLAGVAALPADVDAFFILPVDYPLVRRQVLGRLLSVLSGGDCGIVHPTCCGRRGHPPLLSGRYRDALLQAGEAKDLRSFLSGHTADTTELEVEDLSILIDMDTDDDYQTIRRLGEPDPDGSLSREDALYLLALLETPERLLEHCLAVSAVGEAIAHELAPSLPRLDVRLVSTAGLLHDMARACDRHAAVAGALLSNLGLHRLASVVSSHMVLPEGLAQGSTLREEHLVYLADKLVAGDELVGLEERSAKTLRKLGGGTADPQALEGLRARMDAARRIQCQVESVLGRPLEEVLRRAGL